MVHDLKIWPTWFGVVENGTMPFQIRRADRPFTVGDVLLLREWDQGQSQYTGRRLAREITYIFRATDRAGTDFMLRHDYCVLGIRPAPST